MNKIVRLEWFMQKDHPLEVTVEYEDGTIYKCCHREAYDRYKQIMDTQDAEYIVGDLYT